MIAGETEMLWADHLGDASYDDFLFFGNKEKREARKAARKAKRAERRADPKRIARKEKRKVFFKKLGKAYEEYENHLTCTDSLYGACPCPA